MEAIWFSSRPPGRDWPLHHRDTSPHSFLGTSLWFLRHLRKKMKLWWGDALQEQHGEQYAPWRQTKFSWYCFSLLLSVITTAGRAGENRSLCFPNKLENKLFTKSYSLKCGLRQFLAADREVSFVYDHEKCFGIYSPTLCSRNYIMDFKISSH